jgi:hypothetical protein
MRWGAQINNDSGSEVSEWMSALSGTNEYMVVMNDLHEIRGYNRLAKMASARFLVFLQDDDAPQKVRGKENCARVA